MNEKMHTHIHTQAKGGAVNEKMHAHTHTHKHTHWPKVE